MSRCPTCCVSLPPLGVAAECLTGSKTKTGQSERGDVRGELEPDRAVGGGEEHVVDMPFEPTPEQAELLSHDPDEHGVVLAGPGTGKSATMVAYIDGLAASRDAPRLRLLTFTRAATSELALK